MMEILHLKPLNQVFKTFHQTPTLEYTLKIKGHFACWSHCASGRALARRGGGST